MEPYIVHVTSKGQLTLPSPIRKKLGIGKGSRLFVILDENEVHLKKIEGGNIPVFTEKSSFLNLIGSFEGPRDLARNHDSHLSEES
ncbi:MAG TPA: AbrB/MazE/SpoVT family DNA-binding domain-containing protein [Clostridia bacterium]|nr:AbrB/MazE/SpoVT family DNA-binding domain-containing protein [Clostridia bacterium]